jgi:hypothetical protein
MITFFNRRVNKVNLKIYTMLFVFGKKAIVLHEGIDLNMQLGCSLVYEVPPKKNLRCPGFLTFSFTSIRLVIAHPYSDCTVTSNLISVHQIEAQ